MLLYISLRQTRTWTTRTKKSKKKKQNTENKTKTMTHVLQHFGTRCLVHVSLHPTIQTVLIGNPIIFFSCLIMSFSNGFRFIWCELAFQKNPLTKICLISKLVSVIQNQWCWVKTSLDVEVTDGDVTALEFLQTGYMLQCHVSHPIAIVSEQFILFLKKCSFFLCHVLVEWLRAPDSSSVPSFIKLFSRKILFDKFLC